MRQLLAFFAFLFPLLASAADQSGGDLARSWAYAVDSKIRGAMPHNFEYHYAPSDAQSGCVADIHILRSGAVYGISFPKPCSSRGLEDAIRWVVYAAQPLPLPSDMSVFNSHLIIRFRPRDER